MYDTKMLTFEDRDHIRRIGRSIIDRWEVYDADGVEKEIQKAAEFMALAFPSERPALGFWLMEGLRNVFPYNAPVVHFEERVHRALQKMDGLNV